MKGAHSAILRSKPYSATRAMVDLLDLTSSWLVHTVALSSVANQEQSRREKTVQNPVFVGSIID